MNFNSKIVTMEILQRFCFPKTLCTTSLNSKFAKFFLLIFIGVLWEKIVKKRFPKGIREDMETFRDLYERLIYEEKDKLDRLMGRVQNSYHSLKTNKPQMKLAYIDSVAKPPRGVKRAQEKHGTFIPVGSSLDKVKKQRISKTGNGSPGGGGRISGGGDGGGNATKKSKVAPLMAKTFKMARGLKTGFRR